MHFYFFFRFKKDPDSHHPGLTFKKKSQEIFPNITLSGILERKQETEEGGKRAASRSWKLFFVILSGQSLVFFRDRQEMESGKELPVGKVDVLNSKVEIPYSYTKKKFVFRLRTCQEAEYLFNATSAEMQKTWIETIHRIASSNDKDNMKDSGEAALLEQQQQQNLQCPPAPSENLQQQLQLHNGNRSSSTDSKDFSDGGGGNSLASNYRHQQQKKSSVFDKFLNRKVKQ